ncbi:phage exclusion protein Lit family protein [Vibrio parahaemolyticus]|uniref:phage exclusion protein Lit family protein n=1 Tax=Vibrio parahaemolyticus TaxID=670 RepID=UPI0011235FE1|nr:phage exclusion protein Lit family protein [Vibrio parahaemolyticus]EJG1192097.1 hypothetical protein [Vibrio parahaemolyticus]TOE80325.1 hypothetical protein CGJ34_24520 [Vibrio parahaemolyticus]
MIVENELKELLYASMPEKKQCIDQIISSSGAQVLISADQAGFVLEAGSYGLIRFTSRAMKVLWTFGYAFEFAMSDYAGAITYFKGSGQNFKFKELLNSAQGVPYNCHYNELITSINSLKQLPSEDDYSWPNIIPKSSATRPIGDESGAFDLICLATAYVFLHELKHVQFSSQNNAPDSVLEEEFKCDEFAVNMLTDQISSYVAISHENAAEVKSKRSIGIALATAFLFVLTPESSWDGSDSHPAVTKRLDDVSVQLNLSCDDNYWLYLASFFIAHCYFKNIEIPEVPFSSYKELSQSVLGFLQQ